MGAAENSVIVYNRDWDILASGQTKYVEVPINALGAINAMIAWKDATSSATITLELTNYGSRDAPADVAGTAYQWKDSGVSITGPAASAAGCTVLNVVDKHQKRARLKIDAAANSKIQVSV